MGMMNPSFLPMGSGMLWKGFGRMDVPISLERDDWERGTNLVGLGFLLLSLFALPEPKPIPSLNPSVLPEGSECGRIDPEFRKTKQKTHPPKKTSQEVVGSRSSFLLSLSLLFGWVEFLHPDC